MSALNGLGVGFSRMVDIDGARLRERIKACNLSMHMAGLGCGYRGGGLATAIMRNRISRVALDKVEAKLARIERAGITSRLVTRIYPEGTGGFAAYERNMNSPGPRRCR